MDPHSYAGAGRIIKCSNCHLRADVRNCETEKKEGNGLRKEIADLADTWIRIPMQGQVESLNAAIATSVLMFETARQRRNQR